VAEISLSEVEGRWVEFFFQSSNKWCFGVLKLLVSSDKSFSRASLFKEAKAKRMCVPEKRAFDGFVSRLIEDGFLVQGDWATTRFGKEKPLVVSNSLRSVFRVVAEWNALVLDARKKEVWDK